MSSNVGMKLPFGESFPASRQQFHHAYRSVHRCQRHARQEEVLNAAGVVEMAMSNDNCPKISSTEIRPA